MATRHGDEHAVGMETRGEVGNEPVAASSAAFDEALRASVGYGISGSEGEAGVITGVPEAGRPPRPLLLVVRAGNSFRVIPRRRIERVVPRERHVVVSSPERPRA